VESIRLNCLHQIQGSGMRTIVLRHPLFHQAGT